MKTNKIKVSLSVNKKVVSSYQNNRIIRSAGFTEECGSEAAVASALAEQTNNAADCQSYLEVELMFETNMTCVYRWDGKW